jgi:hypothetical protein
MGLLPSVHNYAFICPVSVLRVIIEAKTSLVERIRFEIEPKDIQEKLIFRFKHSKWNKITCNDVGSAWSLLP